MSRLIDADALLEGREDHEMISTHLIWNAPTIDAVPVVRCKDCAFNDEFAWYACPMVETAKQKDDDFCSKGKRRTDAVE